MENQHPFTLKWMHSDGGVSYFAAKNVIVHPVKDATHHNDRLEFDKADGSDVRGTIDRGRVYILNSQGKTIDTVDLGTANPLPVAKPDSVGPGETISG